MWNNFKTFVLMLVLMGLCLAVGQVLGGRGGMVMGFLFAAVMNFGAYWFSDKVVLAMYRAQEVDPAKAPDLYRMVEKLAQKAGIPTPRVFIIPSESPNAFATGRNPEHAVVAVTQGILRLMNDEELEGVLAHELGHVRNRDILISSISATLAGAVMMLASMARFAAIFGGLGGRDDREGGGGGMLGFLFMALLAPIAALLIQMAISRTREFKADSTGAEIAGGPAGLAQALEKLGAATKRLPLNASPATAHLFIVNPLSGQGLLSMFSTHPPLEERIKRLLGRS